MSYTSDALAMDQIVRGIHAVDGLIADEAQANGTVDHVPVYPREVVKRALELNASAIILVHNHPSGDPTPSDSDIQMTKQVNDAATALGITLHDHLIVGKSTELSFRGAGYLSPQSTQITTRRLTPRPQALSSQAIGIASPNASTRKSTRASSKASSCCCT